MMKLAIALIGILFGAGRAEAFFNQNLSHVSPASISRSSVATVGGGGGGGTPLLFAYNSGKFRQNSGTSLVVTAAPDQVWPNSLVTMGVLTGASTVAHVISQGNKYWTFVSSRSFDGTGAYGFIYQYVSTAAFSIFSATITQTDPSTIVSGFVISSNTNSSASLDVSTNSSGSGTIVTLGTTTASAATTGVCMSVFGDSSGDNNSISWVEPYKNVASEGNGTSFIVGGVGYSTGSVTAPIFSAVQRGNVNLAGSYTWLSISQCWKSP